MHNFHISQCTPEIIQQPPAWWVKQNAQLPQHTKDFPPHLTDDILEEIIRDRKRKVIAQDLTRTHDPLKALRS